MYRGGLTKGNIAYGNKLVKQKHLQKLHIPVIKVAVPNKRNKGTESKQRKQIINRHTAIYHGDLHECRYCGKWIDCKDPKDYTIDHIVPLSMGGANSLANKTPCCHRCNAEKSGFTIDEWLNILSAEFQRAGGNNPHLLYRFMRVQGMKQYVDWMGDQLYKSNTDDLQPE